MIILLIIYLVSVCINLFLESTKNEITVSDVLLSVCFGPFYTIALIQHKHSNTVIWRKK